MKGNNKELIIKLGLTFLISGLIYAGLSAGFDYSDGKEFDVSKFIYKALYFGLVMTVIAYFSMRKKKRQSQEE